MTRAKKMVDDASKSTSCAAYPDMRELLAKHPEIDALLIATGDRWHAAASIMAMQAGKDLYCEKPGSMTVAEGREVADTAKRYGRVFQTGAQRLSEPNFIFATELARTGMLGNLHTLRAHLWGRVQDVTLNTHLPAQPEPESEDLDWNRWLGPVPWRPYNKSYIGGCGTWGIYWDLAAGVAGWGSHTIIQCQAASDTLYTSPVHYAYPGNASGDGLVARFANGVKLVMSMGGWRGSCGVKFEGDEGWTSIADGYSRPDLSSPDLMREFTRLTRQYAAKEGRPFSHIEDFIACVRSRRQPIANAEVMHRSMTANHAMNLCLALKRDLTWDPDREEFVNDDEANRMRSRAQRDPWNA
jgi:predicted dehydrogenase